MNTSLPGFARFSRLILAGIGLASPGFAQTKPDPTLSNPAQLSSPIRRAQPLDTLLVSGASGTTLTVSDGAGTEYVRRAVRPAVPFAVGGALGTHVVRVTDGQGRKTELFRFAVEASTSIHDGGYYGPMFELFRRGIEENEEVGSTVWNGKPYRYFVPWILDHGHTMRGQKYFRGYGSEFVDLLRETQRTDGMIYSFVHHTPNPEYFLTRDKFSGYTQKIGDRYFTRQPTENHPEYMYVNTVYQCWKSGGDLAWLTKTLPSAARALDYAPNDPARWSQRFQLLKRVYTIDSWDFAVDDEYLPNLGLTNSMIIGPVKSKFGVFFGDNTGYIAACFELTEMLESIGQATEAKKYRERGESLKARLDQLAWNGRFYTHFIDEDPSVKRNLGVDERLQLAQSNAYSLNRPLDPTQRKAILDSYLGLKSNLPVGSPGEWYSIFPPFGRGFGAHNEIWQYMNGGVGGHVAGELARGAFESGYETYGADILNRLFELGKKYDNKIYFAYTGSMPPPPAPPVFKPLDLAPLANMDTWDLGGTGVFSWMQSKKGDDLRELPVGEQTLANVRFNLLDPAKNNRRAVVAVSRKTGYPATVEVPVNDTTACVYLLHTASKPASENIVGSVTFVYADGSRKTQYLISGKHLTYWWFPALKTDHSGVAWRGKNPVTEGVGLSWCALNNPEPRKKLSKLVFTAPENEGIYTLLGLTLATKPHYVPVKAPSYGGPDNWAAATAMAALVEGLAGIKDAPTSQAYARPVLAPRWGETRSDTVAVTICYPASGGYVAYRYTHDRARKQLHLTTTGSGKTLRYHLLLPEKATAVRSVRVDGKPVTFATSTVEKSVYADFEVASGAPQRVVLAY
ncbi:MAG: hypothetical protein LH606_06845 [Cytophagaceae bacterium]|nr:hypothetical protein [Cytophagaceae bacterium]